MMKKVPRQPLIRKIGRWTIMGFVYLVAFYLGNLTGEYVAARMPIVSFRAPQLPKFSFPKLNIAWNSEKFTFPGKKTDSSKAFHTQTLIIAGNIINKPISSESTKEEEEEYVNTIQNLAVESDTISVSSVCELTPPFVTIPIGAVLKFTNASNQPHTINIDEKSGQTLELTQPVLVPVGDAKGVHSISCDETIAGFYLVRQ